MMLLPPAFRSKRVLTVTLGVLGLGGLAAWWLLPVEPGTTGYLAMEQGGKALPHQETAPTSDVAARSGGGDLAVQSAGTVEQEDSESGEDPLAPGNLPRLADILEQAGDLSVPENRARAVARMREVEARQRPALQALARERGWAWRIGRPDGSVQELAGVERGRPVYFTTHNAQAAISTGANLLQQAPFGLDGTGVTVGVWDGGAVRVSHREFNPRATSLDGAGFIDHATHVAGTIAGAGLDLPARGMAPAARIDSYDWNGDKTEMTARAAAAPGEPGKIQLSNHSYGYIAGWNQVWGGTPYRQWEWYGSGSSASGNEPEFGLYNSYARDSDALAFSAPYYLMFRSAGNERSDNPQAGQSVALSPGSSTVVTFDSSAHPAGDGAYRGGFDNISFDSIAKNVITITSAGDAVNEGLRHPGAAYLNGFASCGPTDDGRIKPDLTANGDALYSAMSWDDDAYGTFSGTSMSSPNAAGTAALLIDQYGRSFPGAAMRSSTLKGLLLHTADDLGQPGPDYQYGWGLLNGTAAAELIRDHAAYPVKGRMREDLVSSTSTTWNQEFIWDGISPIRATLVWTDPAGTSTSTADSRTARLRNNLDLKIIDPAGTTHRPWVMPFVGTWTEASMSLPAIRGINMVDNVEQVLVSSPALSGNWRCVVSFQGTLANNQQAFSLLLSGTANEAPPPPPLTVSAVSPAEGLPGLVTLDIEGTGFTAGTTLYLHRSGQPDKPASSINLAGGRLQAVFDLSAAAAGVWQITAVNPDDSTATLTSGFKVLDALWSETVDGTVTGWTPASWAVTSTSSHSPPKAWFLAGASTRTTTNLVSPDIPVPSGVVNLQFRFWHSFDLQSTRDAGILEFAIDGGVWFDVNASGSGTSFGNHGYNSVVSSTGTASSRNPFAGQSAWSGNSEGFIQTIVNLTDTAKFAGKNLRARWRLGTNGSIASPGWYVDSISLTADGAPVNGAPVITIPARADPALTVTDPDGTPVRVTNGRTIGLAVTATDDGGAAALTYTWSAAPGAPAPVTFSSNGTAGDAAVTATFAAVGDYLLSVAVQDAAGLTAGSSVAVRVEPVADRLRVDPGVAAVVVGADQAFSAALLDQFGAPLASQPPVFAWTVSGGGDISSSGTFSASRAGGPFVITAGHETWSATSAVTVNAATAGFTFGALTQTADGSPKPVTVTTDPSNLAVALTYGDSGATPPSLPGSYTVTATSLDPDYMGSATATLELRSPLLLINAWGAAEGLVGEEAALTADPDGDGLSNLVEYALGLDPQSPDPLPAARLEPDNVVTYAEPSPPAAHRLTLRFTRPAGREGVLYRVKVSSDLKDWQDISPLSVESGPEAGMESVIARDPVSTAGGGRRFMRLDISTTVP